MAIQRTLTIGLLATGLACACAGYASADIDQETEFAGSTPQIPCSTHLAKAVSSLAEQLVTLNDQIRGLREENDRLRTQFDQAGQRELDLKTRWRDLRYLVLQMHGIDLDRLDPDDEYDSMAVRLKDLHARRREAFTHVVEVELQLVELQDISTKDRSAAEARISQVEDRKKSLQHEYLTIDRQYKLLKQRIEEIDSQP